MTFIPSAIKVPANISENQNNLLYYFPKSLARRRSWIIIGVTLLISWYSLQDADFGKIIVRALSDAYFQVTSFVAATLALFLFLEKKMNIDTIGVMNNSRRWEVPMASLLGAMPGCGGAIIVVTQYVKNRLSFGALLATLTATMGDAAFLLIAREPLTGLFILTLGIIVGTLTGIIVNALHGRDFMRPDKEATSYTCPLPRRLTFLDIVWIIAIVPGVILGIFIAFQFDYSALPVIGPSLKAFGVAGALLCLFMFTFLGSEEGITDTNRQEQTDLKTNLIDDTNFVTSWVLAAFLIYEIGIYVFDIDLAALVQASAPIVPLLAILIGFLPGCGPQILLVTLYLGGIVPVSALIGNAISNDGDALFPAIALAPKAAVIATLYSAIPAFIIAYGYFFLFE